MIQSHIWSCTKSTAQQVLRDAGASNGTHNKPTGQRDPEGQTHERNHKCERRGLVNKAAITIHCTPNFASVAFFCFPARDLGSVVSRQVAKGGESGVCHGAARRSHEFSSSIAARLRPPRRSSALRSSGPILTRPCG